VKKGGGFVVSSLSWAGRKCCYARIFLLLVFVVLFVVVVAVSYPSRALFLFFSLAQAAKRLSMREIFLWWYCCCLCCCRVVLSPALFWFFGVAERKRCYARNFFRQESRETGSFPALTQVA
jgi:hypothetical protein